MTIANSLITAEELFAAPGHDKHCELVNGALITMAPAGGEHGKVAFRLGLVLGHFIQKHGLGECLAAETGFLLSRHPDTVRAPDFAFIPANRVPSEGISEKFIALVPALVVEVLSPRDHALDVADKIDDWLRFGVDHILVVNPKLKTLTVHRPDYDPHILRSTDTLDNISSLPGFSSAVADLFPR